MRLSLLNISKKRLFLDLDEPRVNKKENVIGLDCQKDTGVVTPLCLLSSGACLIQRGVMTH